MEDTQSMELITQNSVWNNERVAINNQFSCAGSCRYSPSEFSGSEKHVKMGNPDMKLVSTSYVERQNLTMRMHMRRFTRLANAFSKKLDNHMYAISLYFMFYNFCKIHKSLRVTPAMEAGISKTLWEISDIVALISEGVPKKRGSYKKKNSN